MLYVLFFLTISGLVFFWLLLVPRQKFIFNHRKDYPLISIVIAVRNEEGNLPELFKSLDELDYPKDKIQVLLGDDESADNSLMLMQKYAEAKDFVEVHQIVPTVVQKAKGNVLMQLGEKAKGEFMLFIDADIRPNPKLILNYLKHWEEDLAGITGVTLPKADSFFARLQRVDWAITLSMGADAQTMGYDVTAMGNNMFVSRKAYEAIGGYRKVLISVVEDFALYEKFRSVGYRFPLKFTSDLYSHTYAISTFGELLKQRKRWMSGGMKVHWGLKTMLFAQALFYPVLLVGLFLFPFQVMGLWIVKTFVQVFYGANAFRMLDIKIPWLYLFFHEIYSCIFTCSLLVYYVLPVKIKWKDRVYGDS